MKNGWTGMARWVAEETIEEIEVPVTILVPLRQVTVEPLLIGSRIFSGLCSKSSVSP